MALRVCHKCNFVLYSYIGWLIDELYSVHPFLTPTPSGSPTDRPNRYRERVQGWSVGAKGGVWWERVEESSSISHPM